MNGTCTAETHAALKRDRETFESATVGLPHYDGQRVEHDGYVWANCGACLSTLMLPLGEEDDR